MREDRATVVAPFHVAGATAQCVCVYSRDTREREKEREKVCVCVCVQTPLTPHPHTHQPPFTSTTAITPQKGGGGKGFTERRVSARYTDVNEEGSW